ncbi:phage tail tape measure protein [Polaromonas sp.]|uniref:phage tail tape measure protein n=1 Tax=Polaromonas sp. TaxID=1869339 RepID=UPI003266DC3D
MSNIGEGVIQLSADASKLKAGIADAKRSIKSLGTATTETNKNASASIDRYVKKLESQAAVLGKSTREAELYKLAIRGANKDQLAAADSALKMADAFAKGERIGGQVRAGFLAVGAAAATGFIAAAVAFDQLTKKAGDFQDMGEKIGDTGENIASLAVAAGTAGTSMDTVVSASQRLTKGLTGVDDESKAAGAAVGALGLNLKEFKALAPADQFEQVAKSLAGFEDGAQKTAVAMALFGKTGAELLPFLKELGQEGGRQVILTQKQIEQADQYADAQAKLVAQISLHAQAIASDMVPAVNEFTSLLADLAKDQDFAATASAILKGALSGAISVFQAVAIVASDVGFVFQTLTREVVALVLQIGNLRRFNFTGFTAISEAVKEDTTRARAELDKFQKRILSIGQPQAPLDDEARRRQGRGTTTAKPKLSFDGADKKGKDTAAQEAKARLALELEDIRKSSDALVNTFSNAEKIMEARRAASLIEERDYYASKLGFINLNTRAQEDALQKELARLQSEKLAGKDKIENDRKILDVEAKIAAVRANSVANVEVLGIREAAAAKKLEQAFADAKTSAQAYLDTVNQQNAREIEGIGRGTKFRELQAGRNQIEDKFTSQRQGLERDLRRGDVSRQDYDTYLDIATKTYAEEVRLYEARTKAMDEAQSNWANGATEALRNYQSEAANIAGQTENLFTNAFQGMEDALVDFVKTGKLDFKSFAQSILLDLARIQAKKAIAGIAGSLFGAGGGGFGSGSAFGSQDLGLSFDGGGFTGSGSRTGGVDGRGGFPAILHPNETVIDHTRGQSGGGGDVYVTVSVDASGSSVESNDQDSRELGQRLGSVVRGVLIQEKRPGGLLAV